MYQVGDFVEVVDVFQNPDFNSHISPSFTPDMRDMIGKIYRVESVDPSTFFGSAITLHDKNGVSWIFREEWIRPFGNEDDHEPESWISAENIL